MQETLNYCVHFASIGLLKWQRTWSISLWSGILCQWKHDVLWQAKENGSNKTACLWILYSWSGRVCKQSLIFHVGVDSVNRNLPTFLRCKSIVARLIEFHCIWFRFKTVPKDICQSLVWINAVVLKGCCINYAFHNNASVHEQFVTELFDTEVGYSTVLLGQILLSRPSPG